MTTSLLIARVLSCVFCVSLVAVGQSTTPRPRVGLALSGGGALGISQIGVIQYFEEHHIPIDAIAGTSMGGLVGGFYASGIDSPGLRRIVEQADWDALLSPNLPFIDQPVVEKQGWNRTFGDLTLRFGRRFALPAGLNSGEALALLLSRNTAGYGDLASFDQLPTPFRCVATDLVSGNAVVLSKGSLAKAMRATMALPAAFTPVQWDNQVLIDGGLVENIPVEAVREMGAEVKIAVVLQTAPVNANQFKSLVGILRQAVAVAVVQNERRSLELANVTIRVSAGTSDASDYEKSKELIKAGYDAAQAQAAELAKFELPPDQWWAYMEGRRQRTLHAPGEGRIVEVEAPDPAFRKDAAAELSRKAGTANVTEPELENVLSGIVAATQVPGASYRFVEAENGYRVEFLQRSGDTILVRPSFRLGVSSGEPSRAALQLSTSITAADAYKSRLLMATNLGYDPGIRVEYYRPLGGSGYFFAPGLFVQRYTVNSYNGPARSGPARDRFGGSFYSGMGTWRFIQLRAGVQAGFDSYSKELVVDGVAAKSHAFANPELAWLYDTQNSGGMPSKGTRIEGASGYSFRNTSFPYLRTALSTFKPVLPRVSLFGLGNIGTSFGTKLNYYEQVTAGGSGQLSAFRYQEFHANTLLSAGGGVIVHGPSIRSLYPGFAAWYEAARMDVGAQGWRTPQSTSAGVFVSTPLGAAGLAVSFDAAGKARVRLSLGTLGP